MICRPTLSFLALMLSCSFLSGFVEAHPDMHPDHHMEVAKKHLLTKDHAAAAKEYSKAANQYSKNANQLRAEAYSYEQKAQKALAEKKISIAHEHIIKAAQLYEDAHLNRKNQHLAKVEETRAQCRGNLPEIKDPHHEIHIDAQVLNLRSKKAFQRAQALHTDHLKGQNGGATPAALASSHTPVSAASTAASTPTSTNSVERHDLDSSWDFVEHERPGSSSHWDICDQPVTPTRK